MIILTNDHGGVKLKKAIASYLQKQNIEYKDMGACDEVTKIDIPTKVIEAVAEIKKLKAEFGVFICTSGVGASISANRHKGIHAVLCHCEKSAKFARLHNNANVICFGQEYIKPSKAIKALKAFLQTEADTTARYIERRKIIDSITK